MYLRKIFLSNIVIVFSFRSEKDFVTLLIDNRTHFTKGHIRFSGTSGVPYDEVEPGGTGGSGRESCQTTEWKSYSCGCRNPGRQRTSGRLGPGVGGVQEVR